MTRIRSAEADAQEAARRARLREEGFRPLDAETEAALRDYRLLVNEESRKDGLPEPRPEPPACDLPPEARREIRLRMARLSRIQRTYRTYPTAHVSSADILSAPRVRTRCPYMWLHARQPLLLK
jgi:hypothetical protein